MIVRTLIGSLWLPVSILIVFAFGDFSFGIYDGRPLQIFVSLIVYMFPLMWVLGMPLTVAVQLIHRRSRVLGIATAAVSAPVSVTAYFLSVPLPSFLNTLFGAALAWLVLLFVYLAFLLGRIFRRATAQTRPSRVAEVDRKPNDE